MIVTIGEISFLTMRDVTQSILSMAGSKGSP